MILWEKMKFINCEMEFKCDADWEKMVLTKDPSVRLASSAKKMFITVIHKVNWIKQLMIRNVFFLLLKL